MRSPISSIVERHDGDVFTTSGDSFAVALQTAAPAVEAALDVQLAFLEPVGGLSFEVRIGLLSGTATVRNGDCFGAAVNRGARLSASARGGQLVLLQATVDLLAGRLPADVELLDLGTHRLRGLSEAERIHQVCHRALAREFPRLRTVEGPDGHLPTQLTSFVGRTRELHDVIAQRFAVTRVAGTTSGALRCWRTSSRCRARPSRPASRRRPCRPTRWRPRRRCANGRCDRRRS